MPSSVPLSVLFVCTANVCRSPSAEAIFESELGRWPHSRFRISSRGLRAVEGQPGCSVASGITGLPLKDHQSRQLQRDDIEAADIVLVMERDQRAAVVRQVPQARKRVFTVREAASISQWMADGSPLPDGLVLPPAPPRPPESEARLKWYVAELDAGRGLSAERLEGGADIADPHLMGARPHDEVFPDLIKACRRIALGFGEAC